MTPNRLSCYDGGHFRMLIPVLTPMEALHAPGR